MARRHAVVPNHPLIRNRSHPAGVQLNMPSTDLHFVEWAMQRAARLTQLDLGRGVASLCTIAAVAPLLGLALVPMGIIGSFVGCGGDRWSCTAALVDHLANAITRCLPGLLTGILALTFHRCLAAQLRAIEVDIHAVSLDLLNFLSRNPPRP